MRKLEKERKKPRQSYSMMTSPASETPRKNDKWREIGLMENVKGHFSCGLYSLLDIYVYMLEWGELFVQGMSCFTIQ